MLRYQHDRLFAITTVKPSRCKCESHNGAAAFPWEMRYGSAAVLDVRVKWIWAKRSIGSFCFQPVMANATKNRPCFSLWDSSLLIITGMGLIFWRLGRDQKVRLHNDYPPWKIHVQHLKQWGWKMSRPPGRCCDSFWGVRSATVWFLFPNLPFPSICCCWHLRSNKASLFAEVPFWQSRTVPCRHLPLLRKHIANGWICKKENKNEQAQ